MQDLNIYIYNGIWNIDRYIMHVMYSGVRYDYKQAKNIKISIMKYTLYIYTYISIKLNQFNSNTIIIYHFKNDYNQL